MKFLVIFFILYCPQLIFNLYSLYLGNLQYNLEHYFRAESRLNAEICTDYNLRMKTDADNFCIEAKAITNTNPYIKSVLDTINTSIHLLIPEDLFDPTIYFKIIILLAISYLIANVDFKNYNLPLYYDDFHKRIKSM